MGLAGRVAKLEERALWRYAERVCARNGRDPAVLVARTRGLAARIQRVGLEQVLTEEAARLGLTVEDLKQRAAAIQREREADGG